MGYSSCPGAASSRYGCGAAAGSGAGAGAAMTPARRGRTKAESLKKCILVKLVVRRKKIEFVK